jgi:hypothetical protein
MRHGSGWACRKLVTPLGKKGPKSLELQSFQEMLPVYNPEMTFMGKRKVILGKMVCILSGMGNALI